MKFETPVVEIKKFDLVDVLTASGSEETTWHEESAADYGLGSDCGPV